MTAASGRLYIARVGDRFAFSPVTANFPEESTVSGIGLGLVLLLLVVLIVLATGRWKANAFLVLLGAALAFGVASGLGLEPTLAAIQQGFGSTLGGVGIVIILGAMIGVFLERTGASGAIAGLMLRAVGQRRSGLALSLTGYVVSIPVFCDSGFIVLVPLARALARKTAIGRLSLAVCLATGLYATHCLVPPTPGPVAAAVALNADLGRVVVLGLPVALLLALVGYWWAMRFAGEQLPDGPAPASEVQPLTAQAPRQTPGALRSLLPILAPLVLITLGSLARIEGAQFGGEGADLLISGLGHPVAALGLGLVLAFFLARRGDTRGSWLAEGIASTAIVLAVTAAGGAFGQVIRSSALSDALQALLGNWKAGVLVPFLLAAALKSAQGSSTVAMITTAAILLPLLEPLGLGTTGWGPALAVVAIACGAMTVSHANDSFFWVVSQMAGIPVATAYRVYTTATGLMGLCGAALSLLLSLVLL